MNENIENIEIVEDIGDTEEIEQVKEDDKSEAKSIKVILVGESGVGKTCIIHRYTTGIFDDETLSTIAISSEEKTITLKDENKTKITFKIWDTCGQEKYRNIAGIFFKDANAVVFVYDSTSENSFNEIKNYWYDKVKEEAPKDVVMAVASNKSDLFDMEQVSEDEGSKYAEEIGASFTMVSAYSGAGINQLFENIGMKYLDLDLEEDEDKKGNLKLTTIRLVDDEDDQQRRYKCCNYY